MRTMFGPWSTAMSPDANPELCTFWKRRLTMLPAVRRTKSTLSRRDVLRLGVTGLCACAVPMVRGGGPTVVAEEEPSLKGKLVVFGETVLDKGTNLIRAWNPDGSIETVAEVKEYMLKGRVSPDGKRMAVEMYKSPPKTTAENPRLPPPDIWMMSADGRERTLLVENAWIACWSSDGKKVAVRIGAEESNGNQLVDVSTKEVQPVPVPPGHVVCDWSQDGKALLTMRANEADRIEIFRVKTDGSESVRVTEPFSNNQNPRSSPDGKKIAFVSTRNPKNRTRPQIFVMNWDGSNVVQVSSFDGLMINSDLTWSPDGKYIACQCFKQVFIDSTADSPWRSEDFHILVSSIDGKETRRLPPGEGNRCGWPDWR